MEKYRFTEEMKEYLGITLHRIQALRNFGSVKAGDLGGWVESEDNLSHEGDCWVSDDAWVYGEAEVSGNAQVYGDALVYGEAEVSGDALVYGEANVGGNVQVYGNACVNGNAMLKEKTDLICICPIGSRNDSVTFYKTDNGIYVVLGCFNGSIKKFEQAVQETHGNNEYANQYKLAIQLARAIIR